MMYRKALVLATPDPESAATASHHASGSGKKSAGTPPDSSRAGIGKAQTDPSRLPAMILAEPKSGRQKELARSVRFTPSQPKEWERIKFDVVVQGSSCKYSQNAELPERLLATANRELVEASPQDSVWGIRFAAEYSEMHRMDLGQ